VIANGGNTNVICRRLQYEAAIPLFRKTEGSQALEPVSIKEEYTDCYKFLKRTFPDMLVSIQNDQAASLPELVGCADIIEVAPPSSYAKKLLRNFESDLAEARATVGDKPLILWIGVSIPTSAARSAENLRAASWLTVLGGANGIIYHLGHDGVPEDRTRLWSVFKHLGREMEVLYPIVATGEMVAAGLVSCDSSFIILSARKFQGDIYVMAVSKAAGATKARIKTGKPGLADSAEVIFEGRSVKIENGEFEDSFTSFEPHLYRMRTMD
ncbi:MAG: hypothetical protein Q7J98_07655, partial [Kiritimatiellia bacterium]|nr:hypothetical protein [Kiritimatiellia bacterium]